MTFSAQDVEQCNLGDDWISESHEQTVQVVQSKYLEDTEMITCSIEKTLEVGKCGAFSLSYGITSKPVMNN